MGVAYFDCFSGVAGDMILGSFIDAGLPLRYLESELKKIKLGGYKLKAKPVGMGGIKGVDFKVAVLKEIGSSSYSDIKKLICKSTLSNKVKQTALAIFSAIATAEARVHREKISDVHFHEVGCVDSIVDIVGAAIGLEFFGFDKIYSSPLPVTRGYVKCAHGTFPVPAPATLELLKGVPVESSPIRGELVTPTGVAIIKTVTDGFGSSPLRVIKSVGYGFGDNKFEKMPNALRLLIGEGQPLMVVETNIDDMNPEFYQSVIEKVLKSGALDAGIMPMVMKKGRPGAMLHLLCEERERVNIIKVIMKETTTFGVRYFPVDREIAERKVKKVRTKWGVVKVKIARYDGRTTTIAPEYADCQKIASGENIPIKEVYRQAILNANP